MSEEEQTLSLPDNDYFDQQLLLHGEPEEDSPLLHHLSCNELETRLASLSHTLVCMVQDSEVQDSNLARWLVEAEEQLRIKEPEKEVRCFVKVSYMTMHKGCNK